MLSCVGALFFVVKRPASEARKTRTLCRRPRTEISLAVSRRLKADEETRGIPNDRGHRIITSALQGTRHNRWRVSSPGRAVQGR
jgi:hypothetical protein